MNKSKFLKRSLAALLSILMVATMIPSAFAAVVTAEDVPTARAADPGYNISVDGNRATWDSANDAYTVSTSFEEGNTPAPFKASMIEVKNHTVTVLSGINKPLKATVQDLALDKAEKSVDSFGVGTYTYNMKAVVTNDEGDVQSTTEFKLIVTLKMEPKSSDATLKAIKSARLPYAIKAEFDNAKNTIEIQMALGKKDYHAGSTYELQNADGDGELATAHKDIFIPTSSSVQGVVYTSNDDSKSGKLVVTAKNGDKKEYAVTFTEESAFDTFKLGDFEGKVSTTAAHTIDVDLPYKYLNAGGTAVTTTDIDKMIAAWTTATGNKVTVNSVAAESGKKTLTFTGGTAGTDREGGVDYITISAKAAGSQVAVQTKKSGAAVPITIRVRVPKYNPDAALTGIQILKGNAAVASASDYTKYVAIDKDQRDITVNLPTEMKQGGSEDANTHDLYVHVWGAKNSKIELASGRDGTYNAFYTGDADGLKLTSDLSSGTPIKLSKPVTLKVVSEDTKTTLYYTLTVKESTSSAATLESLKVVNAKGEEVGTVKNEGKNYTVTLPYKYGVAANSADLKALKVVATGSESAKVAYAAGEATDGAPAAVKAVYKGDSDYSLPAHGQAGDTSGNVQTANMTVTLHGYSMANKPYALKSTNDGSGNFTYDWADEVTIAKVLDDFAKDYNANANDDNWTASVDATGKRIQFEAKTAGNVSTLGISAPTGATEVVTAGKDLGEGASTWIPFVKEVVMGEDTGTPSDVGIFDDDTMSLPLASKAATHSGDSPDDNHEENNIFSIRVFNGADNGSNVYKVTINRADANTEAVIKSAKVTDVANTTRTPTMAEYNTTINTRDAKDTSTIKVAELPHALDEHDMRFSELEVSDEAHVMILTAPASPVPATDDMSVNKTTGANSNSFDVGTGSSCWDEKDNEVKVLVFSEEKWYSNSGAEIADGNKTEANATKVYKMSATYTPAETGSELTSIKSTLDPTIDVSMASKTVTITVPASYVKGGTVKPAGNKFTLNIETSKLATVNACESNGTAVVTGVVSDMGDSTKKAGATEFIAVKSGENYVLKKGDATGNAIGKFTVVSESTKNTSDYNVKILVKPVETSYAINSISAAGKSAVKSADGEVWTLKIPATMEKLQLVDIVTASKLAKVKVDSADYDKETYFDLGDDLKIEVTAENGDAFTYTLKIEEETNLSKETGISSISVSSFVVTKSGNAYTVKVPEAEEVTALPLTINLVDSKAAVTVNGKAYAAGMKVDLTTAATIVVTAEDGTTATTYTLTAVKGDTPTPPKPSDDYTDVPAGELGDYVKQVIDNGIMKGNSATTFNPKGQITRFEFALLIARADLRVKDSAVNNADEADAELIKQYSGKSAYADPKNVELYDAAIEYCTKNSILNGVGNNRFNPDGKVTREMAAKMVTLWAGVADEKLTDNVNKLNDWNSISDWAKPFVNSAYNAKFMQGVGNNNFGPNVPLTRDQVAKIIMLAYNRVAGVN